MDGEFLGVILGSDLLLIFIELFLSLLFYIIMSFNKVVIVNLLLVILKFDLLLGVVFENFVVVNLGIG